MYKKWKKALIPIFLIMFLVILFTMLRNYFNFLPEIYKVSPAHEKEEALMYIYPYLGKNGIWSYFTIQSNVLVTLGVLLVFIKLNKFTKYIYLSTMVYITVTFIVFWGVLAFAMPWDYPIFAIEQILLHGVNPTLALAAFLIIRKTMDLKYKKAILVTMVYPLLYFAMSIVLFVTIFEQKVSIYPFIMFTKPFGLTLKLGFAILLDSVIIIGISLIVIGMTLFYTWISKSKKL